MLKLEKRITLHTFDVEYIDQREPKPRAVHHELCVLDGGRVSALERLGQSPASWICQQYARQGFTVGAVHKGERLTANVDTATLWGMAVQQAGMSERRTASARAYLHPDFCFIMDDDSMECAGIRAGDIVYFTACDHAEDDQIVAVQTDSTVLLLRLVCNGTLLADAPRTRQEHVIRFDELPGAKIIGKAVEVRHIFEWAKKGTDNEEE